MPGFLKVEKHRLPSARREGQAWIFILPLVRVWQRTYFSTMSSETLIAKFKTLPPQAQLQVEQLLDALAGQCAGKKKSPQKPGFKFDWEGGLESLKEQFTAVELQHQINELR
jgi:hypothetical protein